MIRGFPPDGKSRTGSTMRMGIILPALLALLLPAMVLAEPATLIEPPTPAEAADIQTWIPVYCCRTNGCCFKTGAKDVAPLPQDRWKIAASGQILPRTGWSPDGKYWRCACDQDAATGQWIVHAAAHTRCIFPPMQFF